MNAVFIFLAACSISLAGPGPKIDIGELSGTVVKAMWIPESSIKFADLPNQGEGFDVKGIVVDSTLVLVLDNVKGIPAPLRKRINAEFLLWMRQAPLSYHIVRGFEKRLETSEDVMLWVAKSTEAKAKEIQIDSPLKIVGLSYFADDFGGHGQHKELEVAK